MANHQADKRVWNPLNPRRMGAEPAPSSYEVMHKHFAAPIPRRDEELAAPAIPGALLYGRVMTGGAQDDVCLSSPLDVSVSPRGEYVATNTDGDAKPLTTLVAVGDAPT